MSVKDAIREAESLRDRGRGKARKWRGATGSLMSPCQGTGHFARGVVTMRQWHEVKFVLPLALAPLAQKTLLLLKLPGWQENQRNKNMEFIFWLQDKEARCILKFLRSALPAKIHSKKIKEENWRKSWMTFFKPIPVGKRLLVLPPWIHSKKQKITICLNPGMAFGTGEHPTTKMCLAALENHVKPGTRWLDFGTGSGILAIAAAKLGARRVVGIDEDPISLYCARENIQKNQVGRRIQLIQQNYPASTTQFDGIVSNILAEPLIQLAPRLLSLLHPRGVLILSGITRRKTSLVLRAYQRLKARVKLLSLQGDWVCLKITRNSF